MNIPIIRLDVEGMKYSLKAMLTEHAARMDADIQAAVDAYCTPENIGAVVREAAKRALDEAVREEVRNFFSYSGAGRIAVREAVHAYLDEAYPINKEAPK